MRINSKPLLGRSEELKELWDFISAKHGGFVYVRGRRRVGKSRILKELAETDQSVFYFQGAKDSTAAQTLRDFANAVDEFTGKRGSHKTQLSDLKSNLLTWRRIFEELTGYARTGKKPFVLIFDEIQWIAKTRSGCIGAIKAAWLDWERLGIKVIICGSSNRFFQTQTGGEEKILRGLATHSPIWIYPFTLEQVKKFYFPQWTNEEVALTYMTVGGIPYYLERIAEQGVDRGFTHCVNDAIFTKSGIFLQEIEELLGLEFNRRGLHTIQRILECLGQEGKTFTEIQKITGIAKQTLEDSLESLLEYKLVFRKKVAHEKKNNEAGTRYYMKDFYLGFYFQILLPNRYRIEKNVKGFIFGSIFTHNANYYIPDFSGKAFELLTRTVLEAKQKFQSKIYSLLDLKDENYEVLDYWSKDTQIDLLVEHKTDRISRIIDCKWIGAGNKLLSDYIDEVINKQYTPPATYVRRHVLVLSRTPTMSEIQRAQAKGVAIVGLDDLF